MDITKSKNPSMYEYGKVMNIERPGQNVVVNAQNPESDPEDITNLLKAYYYPDGYIGWISKYVIANIKASEVEVLAPARELISLDKDETHKKTRQPRFVFVPMNPPADVKTTVEDEIIAAKAAKKQKKTDDEES